MELGWEELIKFCDKNYRSFIPRSKHKQERFLLMAEVHQKVMALLLNEPSETIPTDDEVVNAFHNPIQQQHATIFLQDLSTRKGRKKSPPHLKRLISRLRRDALRLFDNLDGGLRGDLTSLEQVATLLRSYQRPAPAYALLWAITCQPLKKAGAVLRASPGYKELIKWGANPYLRDFWLRFQKRIGATQTAIRSTAAENLARELSETERRLREDLDIARERISELEAELEYLQREGTTQAVIDLCRILQDRPTPVLDQAYDLLDRLKAKENGNLPSESITMLIVLEELTDALKALGVQRFPDRVEQPLQLSGSDLSHYRYLEGSPFKNDNDRKEVSIIRQGLMVKGHLITPALVKEVKGVTQ